MPAEVVLFDTEFTAWRGSMERGWAGPGEHKEIVQIGAVKLDARTLEERATFEILIKPQLNPVLSDYLVQLTRITNERIAAHGVSFVDGLRAFRDFAGRRRLYSYGRDDIIVAANASLRGAADEWPGLTGTNLKEWLLKVGVPLAGIHSGALARHVGSVAQGVAHDALVDARSLAEAVRYLVAKGAPNPFL